MSVDARRFDYLDGADLESLRPAGRLGDGQLFSSRPSGGSATKIDHDYLSLVFKKAWTAEKSGKNKLELDQELPKWSLLLRRIPLHEHHEILPPGARLRLELLCSTHFSLLA